MINQRAEVNLRWTSLRYILANDGMTPYEYEVCRLASIKMTIKTKEDLLSQTYSLSMTLTVSLIEVKS